MESQNRRTPAYLKQNLLKKSFEYSFFQVMRLLSRIDDQSGSDLTASELFRRVRVRPNLSLAFPASDIEEIKEIAGGRSSRYQVVANFLGLYGVSSPLPTFYTEDLMDEAGEDESAGRDFVDILNNRIYLLFFESLQKYRPFFYVNDGDKDLYKERLFCLEGFGESEHLAGIPDADQLLRYIGLFSQRPRSAEGLKTLLGDALGYAVDITSCVLRKARIPEDQLVRLGLSGGVLGEDCVLGRELDDRMGRFRIEIGPLNADEYRQFFPGSKTYNRLVLLTELYLQDPLEYEVEVFMHAQQAQTVCLGNDRWSKLGIDTWLYAGKEIGMTRNTFYPSERTKVHTVQ